MANAHAGSVVELSCPSCRQPTASLKQYNMVEWFVFVVLFMWARRVTYTACPQCMRRFIANRFVMNLVPANVTMIMLGPFMIGQYLRTFSNGHSKSIVDSIEQQRALAAANMPTLLKVLPAVMSLLDRGERAGALRELRLAHAQLHRVGGWEQLMPNYVAAVERGQTEGFRTVMPLFPSELQEPLEEILVRFATLPLDLPADRVDLNR